MLASHAASPEPHTAMARPPSPLGFAQGDGVEVRVLVALLAGLAVAVALGQLVRHILVGVTPHDPLALLLAGVVVAVVSDCIASISGTARSAAITKASDEARDHAFDQLRKEADPTQ